MFLLPAEPKLCHSCAQRGQECNCIESVANCNMRWQKTCCNFHTPHAGQWLSLFCCFQSLLQREKPFRNIQYNYSICYIKIHHKLSARGKYRAAPEVSTTGATYACPRVTYIFLSFPQPSRRNLFESVKTRDGSHGASCVRFGQAGAISVLRKSQRGRGWCSGLLLSHARKVCSAREGAVPAPRATVTSRGAPWCTRDQHIRLHLVTAVLRWLGHRASPLPQQLLLQRGTVTDFEKKKTTKKQTKTTLGWGGLLSSWVFNEMKMLTLFIKNHFKSLGLCLFLFCLALGIEKMEKADMKSHRKWYFTSILAKASLIPTVKIFQWCFSHIKIPFILLRNLSFPEGGKSIIKIVAIFM